MFFRRYSASGYKLIFLVTTIVFLPMLEFADSSLKVLLFNGDVTETRSPKEMVPNFFIGEFFVTC